MALAENLEAVADPEYRPAGRRVPLHRLHHRAEAGDGTGPQVVAVAEAAGQDHHVGSPQVGVAVPDEVGVHPGTLGAPQGIEVGVAAGEPHHRQVDHQPSSTSTR
jgi:hypothetical protein